MNESADVAPVTTTAAGDVDTTVPTGTPSGDIQRSDGEQRISEPSTDPPVASSDVPPVPTTPNKEEVKQGDPGQQTVVTGTGKKTRAPRKPASTKKTVPPVVAVKSDDKTSTEYIDTTGADAAAAQREESQLPRVSWRSLLIEPSPERRDDESPIERDRTETAVTPNGIAKPDKPGYGRGPIKRIDLDEEYVKHFKPAEFPGGGAIFGRNNIAQQALQRARERMSVSGKNFAQTSETAGPNNMNY